MPFYNENNSINSKNTSANITGYNDSTAVSSILNAIIRFFSINNVVTKAVEEALMYFTWGTRTKNKSNSIAL